MAYTVDLDTVNTFMRSRHLPTLTDNIFVKGEYVADQVMKQADTYAEEKIIIPLEYASASNAQKLGEWSRIVLTPKEIATGAQHVPQMMGDSILLSEKRKKKLNSDQKVISWLESMMSNVKRGFSLYWRTRMWSRGAADETTPLTDVRWNSVANTHAITALGGIPATGSVPSWWKARVLAAGTVFEGNPLSENDLTNPNKGVFLEKIIMRLIAQTSAQCGIDPDVIAIPKYLFNLFVFILEGKKTLKQDAKMVEMGITHIKYDNTIIVADKDMVKAQVDGNDEIYSDGEMKDEDGVIVTASSDADKANITNDGRMYSFTWQFFKAWFTAGARFDVRDWVKESDQPAESALILTEGNIGVSNRMALGVVTGLRSPWDYQ